MNIQDPISDMIVNIKNNQISKKKIIFIKYSKIKENIISLLKEEGFISNYRILKKNYISLIVKLKYFNKIPAIKYIKRLSKPSLRIYNNKNIPKFMEGIGTIIISTSKGIMTDKKARILGIGGELICKLY